MALGDQSKALIIVSKNKGWDPTVIQSTTSPEGKVYPSVDISNFDKAPNPWELGAQSVGKLPEGIHDNYPQDTESPMSQKVTFDVPEASRETDVHHTSGADPFPGGGWGGL